MIIIIVNNESRQRVKNLCTVKSWTWNSSKSHQSVLLSQCQRQGSWLTGSLLLHLFPDGFMRILSCNEPVNWWFLMDSKIWRQDCDGLVCSLSSDRPQRPHLGAARIGNFWEFSWRGPGLSLPPAPNIKSCLWAWTKKLYSQVWSLVRSQIYQTPFSCRPAESDWASSSCFSFRKQWGTILSA